MEIKVILLLLFLFLFFYYTISFPKFISSKIGKLSPIFWICIFLFSNIFYLFLGQLYGHDALKYYFKTEVLWIVLYSMIFLTLDCKSFFVIMKTILLGVKIVLVLGIIAFLLFNFSLCDSFANFSVSLRPGYSMLAIAGGSVTSIVFGGTLLCLFAFEKCVNKLWLIPLFLFVFATSRRALIFILLFSIMLYYFFCVLFPNSIKVKMQLLKTAKKIVIGFVLIFIIGAICNSFLHIIDFSNFFDFVANAFKTTKDSNVNVDGGGYLRALQAESLIKGWKEHVFLGSGIAANADIVRSEIPGAYELTYLAILFQRGLIGFVIYISFFCYMFYNLFVYALHYKQIRQFLFIVFISFLCFMIANGTNPYLGAFDYMWYMFVPLSVVKLMKQSPHKFIKEYQKLCKLQIKK